MKIAIDVDNTIYDTDRCSLELYQAAAKELKLVIPKTREEVRKLGYKTDKRIQLLRCEPELWFNSKYLITSALEALKAYIQEKEDVELYILTARSKDLKFYEYMLKDDIKLFKGIIQKCDYAYKTDGCIAYDIDILVDDAQKNLVNHILYTEGKVKGYKTKFIHYIGHSEEAQQKYIEGREKEQINVYTMKHWNEFKEIMQRLEV